ncbi:MAG TPA: hypothetical protein VHC46_01035 [Thermodesulfobacteriota bacterium]|nr:hypothetical protein [Thermodesulfobacteriota bacterium]
MSRYLILLIAVVLALVYFLYPRGDDTSEIRAVFDRMKEAASNKDTEAAAEHFSLQYKDEYGASYPIVKNAIENTFRKYDNIEVSYSGLSVIFSDTESGEKEAVANLDVTVTAKSSGMPYDLIGSEGSPDNVTVTLRKSGLGGWKITGVEGLDEQDNY